MCPVLDEVVGPDVVRALRPEPNARPVVQPEPPLLSLLLWDLQPFTSPLAIVLGPMADKGFPLDPLVVHVPASVVQQTRHHAIPIAPVLVGQLDDIVGKTLFVGTALRDLALRGSVLAKCTAGAALGYAKLLAHVVDAFAAAKGSEVSPCSLSQNELVQRQVRHRPT